MDKSLARLLKDSDEASADKKKAASEAARAALAIAGKMKIEEQKHFAGQTISVVRSVAKSSAEAQQAAAKASEAAKQSELDKIVSELKNPKKSMSAVEKSSHDWDQFKEEKGIGDQLEAYAKDGYVEKQQFLQRVEERQFEAGRAERERARAMADAAAAAAKKR
ncbi:Craniofacial development protein 1 [Hondaea fermentalgiana]|uniref:Craniofacial development protein 1 n=1 Tax=Hondaea fermentalgiana TaxID=2315210 RepID=A0A2R5G4B6_9STRA|nr:Craniofacial development protein 1 [Hondaea fermentalgiana]|eukprot:GBG25840.1 Craniofacial development protein 1 [Hondaea fermentalgiana]